VNLDALLAAPPVTLLHASLAVVALGAGLGALATKKGTAVHVAAGRVFAVAMLAAAITSFGIADVWRGSYGPIHLLSILTLATLPLAVRAARRGDTRRHARVMMLNFMGLVIAGVFAVASPGRVLNKAFATAQARTAVASQAR
jgi:uncharacterized membrane protein